MYAVMELYLRAGAYGRDPYWRVICPCCTCCSCQHPITPSLGHHLLSSTPCSTAHRTCRAPACLCGLPRLRCMCSTVHKSLQTTPHQYDHSHIRCCMASPGCWVLGAGASPGPAPWPCPKSCCSGRSWWRASACASWGAAWALQGSPLLWQVRWLGQLPALGGQAVAGGSGWWQHQVLVADQSALPCPVSLLRPPLLVRL